MADQIKIMNENNISDVKIALNLHFSSLQSHLYLIKTEEFQNLA